MDDFKSIGPSCHRRPAYRLAPARPATGFSLVELLIVIAVIAGLIALLLPVLASMRTNAQRALCASNLRQIGMAAKLYAADNTGYMGQAAYLNYRTPGNPYNGQSLPGCFQAVGFTNTFTIQPDHYLAMNYLPLGSDAKGNPGSTVFNCPTVPAKVGPVSPRAFGGVGNVESHYFFSSLLSNPGPGLNSQNNGLGPYRIDQVLMPSNTFFAGDAVALADPTHPGSPLQMDSTFAVTAAGQRSTGFGVVANILGAWTDNPPTYHPGGPNALCFDGHVETVPPPPPTQRFALRSRLTADGTENLH